MAALARKGKFPKVIAAIDEMVVGLKKEQQEEVEHKDFCNDKFHELEMTTMKKTEEQSGLEAKIADTTNHLEADKEKIVQPVQKPSVPPTKTNRFLPLGESTGQVRLG